jgi:hypothetical protein
MNTQKHYRVIGDRNFADPYSSAATFDGFSRAPPTFDDATPWAWVKPRTWMLGVGWRRHGLLDPADTPASARWRRCRSVSDESGVKPTRLRS